MPAKGTHGLGLDVAHQSELGGESACGFVIGRFEQEDDVVSAHRPECLRDFCAHFLSLGRGGVRAFGRVLDVADALVGKLKKTDKILRAGVQKQVRDRRTVALAEPTPNVLI